MSLPRNESVVGENLVYIFIFLVVYNRSVTTINEIGLLLIAQPAYIYKFRKMSCCLNVYGRRKRGRVGVKQCMHSFHI